MRVYCVSDASFCLNTNVAAWAAKTASRRGTYMAQGIVATKVGSSNAAEMHAVLQGLQMARQYSFLMPGDDLVVRVDSQYVVDAFRDMILSTDGRPRLDHGRSYDSVAALIATLVADMDLTVRVVQDQGHTSHLGRTLFAKFMADVDAASRALMRKTRDEILAAQGFRVRPPQRGDAKA